MQSKIQSKIQLLLIFLCIFISQRHLNLCAQIIGGTENSTAETMRLMFSTQLDGIPKKNIQWKNAQELHTSLVSRSKFLELGFEIDVLYGSKTATNVLLLIPQIHISETIPLHWNSIGFFTIQTQKRIDLALTFLHRDYALKSIGSEGSSEIRILLPWNLQRIVWKIQSLESQHQKIEKILEAEGLAGKKEITYLQSILNQTLNDHLQMLDGIGVFQSRLANIRLVHRFGLENPQILSKALSLAHDLELVSIEIGELQSKLEKPQISAARDPIAELWLNEIRNYQDYLLYPLQQSLQLLQTQKKELLKRKALDSAQDFNRFIAFIRGIDSEFIHSEEINFYTQHFKKKTKTSKNKNKNKLTQAEINITKQKIKKLEKQQNILSGKYREVTFKEREKYAVKESLQHFSKSNKLVVLVMGKNHLENLIAEIKKQDLKMGIIVLKPYKSTD